MKDRRFRLLVDPYQSRLLRRIVAYWLIYQLSLWNCLFFWRLLQQGKGNPLEQYANFFEDYYPMLFCFIILVPFFAWDAVRMSHRLLGAINRFRQAMRTVTAGQPVRRIQLREGDHLDGMLEDFNAMLEALERRGAVTLVEPPRGPDDVHPCQSAVPSCALTAGDPHDRSDASETA